MFNFKLFICFFGYFLNFDHQKLKFILPEIKVKLKFILSFTLIK